MQIALENEIRRTTQEIERGYDAGDVPIKSYAALMGAYALVFTGLFLVAKPKEHHTVKARGLDWVLLTIASYKFSRIITMSFIGTPLRAPFTKRGQSLKGGEVQDESRGEGLQKAIGNLVTCPFCFNVWSTTFFVFGHSLFPRATMKISQILSIAAAGDVLHHGYRTLREKSE